MASFSAPGGGPLDAGQLAAAANHLAQHATAVGIVTGFCAILDERVTAETDGPPSALFLARALLAVGIDVVLITDRFALPLLEAGCDLWKLDRKMLWEFPFEDGPPTEPARLRNDPRCNTNTDRWVGDFYARFDASRREQPLSHLVSIERPGPSHTLESLRAQPRTGAAPLERFTSEVPLNARNVCHTMRGNPINGWTAKTHRLFEWIREKQLGVTTIGIGDGGNELGMGHFAWELLAEAVGGERAGRIACRIDADFGLIAGVSDWAAYGLALALARLRGAGQAARDWHAAGQRELIETFVRQTPAVDGVTLRREPTVDGLQLDDYVRPLVELRRCLGCSDAGDE
jgi:hypothetical protein